LLTGAFKKYSLSINILSSLVLNISFLNNSFFAYLQQLELMTFFSGYPLLYTVILFLAGNRNPVNNFKAHIVPLLPFAYALVGTLYLGLQLKNLYLNYSPENLTQLTLQPYLMLWGLLSVFFWLPSLSKKKALSLLHSLVFFFFLVRDFVVQLTAPAANTNMVKNDMRIYTVSFLLNLGVFAFVALVAFLFNRYKKTSVS
jgi:hypothetical protein